MGYSTVDGVKKRFPQESSWTEGETAEMEECIKTVDAEIDSLLQRYIHIPLTSIPQLIKDTSADLAAYEFAKRRPGPQAPERTLREDALQRLQTYIYETYRVHPKIEATTYQTEPLSDEDED